MNYGTCIHYIGLNLKGGTYKCAAGVDYEQAFDGDRPGVMLRAPCIKLRTTQAHNTGICSKPDKQKSRKKINRDEVVMACSLRLEPTAEQIDQDRLKTEQLLRNTLAGLRVASKWRVKRKLAADRSEIVECPVCKGKLHLSQSASNERVHNKCETEGCVSWRE
ncbi:MAG: hypothetical protein V4713_03670 [Pseudomonadota bacterium]